MGCHGDHGDVFPALPLLHPDLGGCFKSIHLLYGPKSRLAEFPQATWAFLVHAACNLARALAVLHAGGNVVGDINHGNVLVSSRGVIKLIDCDSFQIQAGERRYLCEVGVPTHTPPELQGHNLRTVTRTPNHDAFGLAVVIFQLLFLGRHPFSGTFLGRGDMPLERAIRELRFAYGRFAATRTSQASEIIYKGEGMMASVAVSRLSNGVLNYHNAGKVQASSEPQDMRLQRMLGHLTTLLPPQQKTMMVIGFGAGATAVRTEFAICSRA